MSAKNIKFMQNDDWCYYKNVESLSTGNLTLQYRTAPIFYMQGLMGVVFSKIAGFNNIPILTLIISLMCIACIFYITKFLFKKNLLLSLCATLMLTTCPLFVYSTLGFMTENYFVFFMLLAILSIISFEISQKNKFIYLSIVPLVSAFFVRQLALTLIISIVLYFFITGRKKLALIYIVLIGMLATIYTTFLTGSSNFAYVNGITLYNIGIIIEKLIISILYVVVFSAPLLLFRNLYNNSKLGILIRVGLAISFAWLFVQANLFPVGNIFTYYGFIGEDIYGTRTISNISKMLIGALITTSTIIISLTPIPNIHVGIKILLAKRIKSSIPLYLIITGLLYLVSIAVTNSFFDRYIYPLIVISILLTAYIMRDTKESLQKIAFAVWISICIFINYNFTNQYIVSHNLIWSKSKDLQASGIKATEIKTNVAWNLYNESNSDIVKLLFSYQPNKFGYENVETFKINYPLSVGLNYDIYLLKCRDVCYKHTFKGWEWGL